MPDFKKFYNPYHLLSMKDINGSTPEVYMTMSNRSAGKTYGFSYVFSEEYLTSHKKFALYCRYQRELGTIADGIFSEMLRCEYPGWTIKEQIMSNGVFSNLYFEHDDGSGEEDAVKKLHCGYVLPINAADSIKKLSSLFSDTNWILFDEFQCASLSSYCQDEIEKFISLHMSVARGGGESSRYCPVIMLSNSLSILNPYFSALSISSLIQPNTRKLRGDGFVLERFVNPYAAEAQKQSAFNRAFGKSRMIESSIDNAWLNDSETAIEKPTKDWGRSDYFYTLVHHDKRFGVRYYPQIGLFHLSKSVDGSCPYVFSLTIKGGSNLPFLKKSAQAGQLRDALFAGQLRFADQECKQIALDLFV